MIDSVIEYDPATFYSTRRAPKGKPQPLTMRERMELKRKRQKEEARAEAKKLFEEYYAEQMANQGVSEG